MGKSSNSLYSKWDTGQLYLNIKLMKLTIKRCNINVSVIAALLVETYMINLFLRNSQHT